MEAGLGPVATVLLTDTFVSLLRLLKQKQIFLTTCRNRERKPERRDDCVRRQAPAGSLQKVSRSMTERDCLKNMKTFSRRELFW